jgi:hypothetical protein
MQQALDALKYNQSNWIGKNEAIAALEEALAKPEQEPVAWVSATDNLQKSGVTVLACYKNSLGKSRRIRAMWIAAKTEECGADCDSSEYDEETDACYLSKGWYECIDNWGDYSSVKVCEGEVTHWMSLPPAPDEVNTAPPKRDWVGLTDDYIVEAWGNTPMNAQSTIVRNAYARAIEAKLKELNKCTP